MPLRHIDRLEPAGLEKLFRPGVEALSVLHLANRMISDPSLGGDLPRHRLAQPEARDHLGYITGERSDPRCLLGIGRFATPHEAVIFYRRAAPRRVDSH